jgi:hypothetical protein
MKAVVICVVAGLILSACSKTGKKEDGTSIIGNWKEYESYMDPGDGSGSFQAVDGITLQINADSTYTAGNGHFAWGTSGRISLLNDSTINIRSSQSTYDFRAIFKRNGDVLQLNYFCIEGCGSRFRKINAY